MFKVVQAIGAVATALFLFVAPASAQDWTASPNYGSVNLTTGFQPDPYFINLTAGGSIDVSRTLGGSCRGFVTSAPDFDLYFTGGSNLPLAISVTSSSDTTLVINGPNGTWYCDDDSGNGLNPSIVFNYPQSGLYDIWVGTYGSTPASAQLAISELSTY